MGCKNILLITSDQQHYNTIGINNPEIETPNLDRLARQGMLFSRAYCPNPTCTPTRASLITGLYPSQHGAWTLGTKLPECVPTIGDYLNKEGYEVIEAANGEEALTIFENEYIDLGIIDVMMPKMDGFELVESMKEFKDVPCIMLTAKGESKDKLRGFSSGLMTMLLNLLILMN